MSMPTLNEIKAAIAALPDEQKTALKRWLDEIDADIFDRKIEQDAASGKLDRLLADVSANSQR